MKPETIEAYRAWKTAVERGYGSSGRCDPVSMARVDARIRKLKAAYEKSLAASCSVLDAGPL